MIPDDSKRISLESLKPEDFSYELDASAQIHDEYIDGEAIGFFKDAFLRFRRNKASVASFWIISFIVLMGIFGPNMNEHTFRQQNADRTNMPPLVHWLAPLGIFDGTSTLVNRRVDGLDDVGRYPPGSVLQIYNEREIRGVKVVDIKVDYYKYVGAKNEAYWFGTDYMGRDLWTRLWRGARVSLLIALIAVLTNIFIGIVYGAIAGYYGGKLDMLMMRLCEIVYALPQVVVVTMFILLFGPGFRSLILALIVRGWVPTARMIRSQFLRFRGREYVMAAKTLGAPDRALVFRHILPNSIGPIITRTMIAIPGAIFTESFLAFIGLGLPAPEPSIGVLLSDGQSVLLQYPFQTLFPALLISILMIAFNLMSNGLRDAFDPTQRGIE